ncbi:MAG: hypothetical protein ACXW3C_15355 [Pyrinomonadaceae bacterium]
MRQPGAKSNHTTLRIVALLIFALASAAAVCARFYFEPGAAISQTNEAAVIKVTAVGRDDLYDTVASQEKLNFHVKVRGSCDDGWKIRSAIVKIHCQDKANHKIDYLDVNPTLGTIGFDNGEKWSFQVATFPYLPPDTQSSPVAMCNAELERRLARGDSKADVLSKGFDLTNPHGYFAALSVTCVRKKNLFYENDGFYADTRLPVTISCQPTDYKVERTPGAPKRTPGAPKRTPPLPGRLPVPEPPIESVSLVADPLATTGRQCPVYVNFRGKIEAGENSTYQRFNTKYRFVGDRGYKTPWTFVAIKLGEPRAVFGRRFIQAPTIDPGRTILAPGEKPKIPLYRGWTELEVQLPNGSIRSERANFTVDCNVAPGRPRIKASND